MLGCQGQLEQLERTSDRIPSKEALCPMTHGSPPGSGALLPLLFSVLIPAWLLADKQGIKTTRLGQGRCVGSRDEDRRGLSGESPPHTACLSSLLLSGSPSWLGVQWGQHGAQLGHHRAVRVSA